MNIQELILKDTGPRKLHYHYQTASHYALAIKKESGGWSARLTLKRLPKRIEKKCVGDLYAPHIDKPKVFAAYQEGREVGLIEVALDSWNNRLRVWELLVHETHMRRGVATSLMRRAVDHAREIGARMIVLETQSCNIPAIEFYKSQGFELIGFDSCAYSNRDAAEGEVRLEFGLRIA